MHFSGLQSDGRTAGTPLFLQMIRTSTAISLPDGRQVWRPLGTPAATISALDYNWFVHTKLHTCYALFSPTPPLATLIFSHLDVICL
ncbi:hypothetical protein N7E81_18995 [Reichenbachiella carrageenanivorans]|uniref:Uncharacterized protein n=1 Tax=Reichenbachiella carrageenanivorans TaxID=2979869 RepID=A0ABY6D0I7_9BACT|nr:hypothetical protein [Reichenbachiella carrageenanivorans]UXX79434.1 hypothetical protein N7E81_18960 [Reichenbachiella carrageenanivorans]UXX79440.1 hypothetical protein N7E81_18995 [Reichenbachiella carrageenanivorans]